MPACRKISKRVFTWLILWKVFFLQSNLDYLRYLISGILTLDGTLIGSRICCHAYAHRSLLLLFLWAAYGCRYARLHWCYILLAKSFVMLLLFICFSRNYMAQRLKQSWVLRRYFSNFLGFCCKTLLML